MADVSAIRVSTKLKTDGIAKDRKRLENELKQLQKDAEKANITKAISANDNSLSKTREKLKGINDEYEKMDRNLSDIKKKTTDYVENNSGFTDIAKVSGMQAESKLPVNSTEEEKAIAYAEAYNQTIDEAIQKRLSQNEEYQKGLMELNNIKIKQEELNNLENEQLAKQTQLNSELSVRDTLLNETSLNIQKQFNTLSGQEEKAQRLAEKEQERLRTSETIQGALEKQSKTIGGMFKKVARLGLSVLGVRAAYSGIRKIVNEVLDQNQELKNTMDSIWSSISSAFAPVINSLISGFAQVLNYVLAIFKALTGINLLAKSTKKNTSGVVSDTSKLASFDSSEVLNKDSGGGASGTNANLLEEIQLNETLVKVLERMKAIWDTIGKAVSNVGKAIKKAWDHAGNGESIMQSLAGMGESLLSFFERIADATLRWSETINFIPLLSSIAGYIKEYARYFENILQIGSRIYEQIILPVASFAIEGALPVFFDLLSGALSIINGVLETLMPVWDWFYENVLSPAASWAGGAIVEIFGALASILSEIGAWFSDNSELISGFLLRIGEIIKWLWEEVIQRYLNYAKDQIMNVINYIKNHIETILETVSTIIGGVIEVFDGLLLFLNGDFAAGWEKIWHGLQTIFAGIWNGMIEIVENVLNAIIGAINAVIRALNTISFKIPNWVPFVGGNEFGLNLQELGPANLESFKWKVPPLATGAVLPPNKPFLAMLGDQTTGRNLETPESLLRQIVQEETGNNQPVLNLIANGDTGQLIRFLKWELEQEENRTGKRLVEGAT